MTYGEEYVKNYNKNLTKIVSNAISIFQDHYNSNYSFFKVEKIIAEPLKGELNFLRNNLHARDDLFQEVHNWMRIFKENYTEDKTISVINDEIKNKIFETKEDKGGIIDYQEFLNLLYIRESIRDYFIFMHENEEILIKKYNAKKISEAFVLLETKRETHILEELSNKNIVKKSKVAEIIQLNKNEKLVLLNIFMRNYKNPEVLEIIIPDTESFRLLILCSDVFNQDEFFKINTNNTDYEYFRKGIYQTEKNFMKRKNFLQNIIDELEKVENLNNIRKLVKKYKTKLKNH